MLAPAGGGVHVVSTGLQETRALQRAIYHASHDDEVIPRWQQMLARIPTAKVAILGVPSDTGAGFIRGCNRAPAELRKALLSDRSHPIFADGVIDVGDVRVIPHFLADEMLSDAQIAASRKALYGDEQSSLPVSPLDICARVLKNIFALNPRIKPITVGGDHSVGWPAFSTAFKHAQHILAKHVGLLHFDAHTDLLAERLGVRYCFATWAYHANELLNRDGRLVQVGIRASARDREYWESSLGVRQYWPENIQASNAAEIGQEIIAHFQHLGVDSLYISNDIDATDIEFAAATGTPEANGLHPAFVRDLTQQLSRAFPLIGGDLVEVAPPLSHGYPGEPAKTLQTSTEYLADLIEGALKSP